jgi:hypothetical protein
MENEKSKKDKQDKKTTEGEAREKEEEIKTTERLALDLELTLGRNLSRRPSPLVVSPAEFIGSPCRSGASTPGSENLGMVEFMWDEVKCQSVARKEPKNPEMGQPEDKDTINGKDRSGAVPKLMLNQLSKLQKISSLTDDSPRKRKVADTSMETDVGINPYKKRESLEVANLKEAMDAVTRIGGKIEKVVKNLYQPKRELVDLVAKLNKWTAVFKRETLKAWMEAHKYEPVEKAMIDVDTQADVERENEVNKRKETTRNIGCQTDPEDMDGPMKRRTKETEVSTQDAAVQVDLKPELRTCETQTGAWSNSTKELKTLEKTDTFEQWGAIANKKWKEDLFTNTVVVVGTPFETKDDVTKVVLVEPEDRDMDKGIQRAFRERYPELRFGDREVDVVEQTTRVRSQLPGEVARRKVVKIMHDGMEGDLWSKFCELRKETESDVRVAMHHVNSMGTERLRKMAEAVFHGTGTTVAIYTTQAKMEEGRKGVPPEGKKKDVAEVLRESRGRAKGALIIKAKDERSAKEVLQLMRTSINLQEVGVSVKGLARNDSGEIKIDVQETKEGGRMSFKRAAESYAKDKAEIAWHEPRRTIMLRDVDNVVSEEEIRQAICAEAGDDVGQIEVHIKKPEQGTKGRKTYAMVTVNTRTAQVLENKERLRVGWSQFRTRALERPAKCFRCQEFGHLAADCKSAVEKKEACYRCGGPGHFARNCKEEAPKCYSCGESGHLARSMRCRNYKAAVDQIRRQDRDRKPNRRTSQSAGQD